MEKKIEDYLHFYLGCQCKENVGGRIFYLNTVHENRGVRPTPELRIKDVSRRMYIEEFKLILRPLPSITHDEADYFAWLCMDSEIHLDADCRISQDEIQTDLIRNDGGTLLDDDIEIYIAVSVRCFQGAVVIKKDGSITVYDEDKDSYNPVDNIAQKVVYLLSRGFDLFGLIPAGLAIDSTTLNPSTGE